MNRGWRLFLDDTVSAEEREAAWSQLRDVMRQPVLLQMRRVMEGWRRTEQLTDEFCEQLHNEFDGRGLAMPRFRLLVLEELHRFLTEHQIDEPEIGDEFDRDWASCLLHGALRGLKQLDPTAHLLLMRAYDRPEGGKPWSPRELALKLEVDPDEVEEALAEGIARLDRLFNDEIARTVSDEDLLPLERQHLGRFTRAMFPQGVAPDSNGEVA